MQHNTNKKGVTYVISRRLNPEATPDPYVWNPDLTDAQNEAREAFQRLQEARCAESPTGMVITPLTAEDRVRMGYQEPKVPRARNLGRDVFEKCKTRRRRRR